MSLETHIFSGAHFGSLWTLMASDKAVLWTLKEMMNAELPDSKRASLSHIPPSPTRRSLYILGTAEFCLLSKFSP